MHHQLHLIAQKQIKKPGRLPNASYFSALATIVNVWRAGGNHRKLREAWEELTTKVRDSVAASAADRMPAPQPLPRGSRGFSETETRKQNMLRQGAGETLGVALVDDPPPG
eukprot:9492380-Pyramimonas_sp.AAC.1